MQTVIFISAITNLLAFAIVILRFFGVRFDFYRNRSKYRLMESIENLERRIDEMHDTICYLDQIKTKDKPKRKRK